MGLSLGAAIVLGSVLAPTDPVLAGDLGVGPPGDEDEREPNFSVTGEAGLNDGLAFPFVLLGLLVAGEDGPGWLGEWVLADVALRDRRRRRHRRGAGLRDRRAGRAPARPRAARPELDGWLAVAAVLTIYGATEIAGAYGFLAAFAGGVAFRRYEHGHEYNRRVHDGAEVVEKFGELALVLMLGSHADAGRPRRAGADRLAARAAAAAASIRPLSRGRRAAAARPARAASASFVAWFGVRGIGSLYYVAFAIGVGGFDAPARPRRPVLDGRRLHRRLDRRPRPDGRAAQPPLAARVRRRSAVSDSTAHSGVT